MTKGQQRQRAAEKRVHKTYERYLTKCALAATYKQLGNKQMCAKFENEANDLHEALVIKGVL
jgi:hypothetical protein